MGTAIVTGAGSGIGRAVARSLAARGITVLAVGRRLDPLVETQASAPNLITPISVDISDLDERADLIRRGQKLDASYLVHAAGIFPIEALPSITLDSWRSVFAINLEARLFLSQALTPTLGREGRILFIGSMSATTPRKGALAYCASKAASYMLQECLKQEFGETGPAVGISIPGPVKTDMVTRGINADNDVFPDGADYDAAPLIDPQIVGRYLTWLMCETGRHEYIDGQWDIRDTSHHAKWLGQTSLYISK